MGNIWGDYARTIIVENGMVVEDIGLIENPEWKSGLQMEEKLHAELLCFATKETTFEKLYYHMNEFIVENTLHRQAWSYYLFQCKLYHL